MERRLAAILALDVVGYSRLMEADETGTFARLRAHQRDLIEPEIARHNGRIFKVMGDGLLAEFPSVVEAVECAVVVQRAMAGRNDDAPADLGIDVRMAVNLGDVIVDGEDRYGDGVNIAARLEKLAEPGGLIISRAVYEQVRSKLSLRFEDLGDKALHNIAEPISVYRVSPQASLSKASVLTVTVSPNFAAKWLVHRLGHFAKTHPDIDLRISASLHHANFAREEIDVAIRHGDGQWPGLHVTRLVAEELFPVCSPKLLRGRYALRSPNDLKCHTLLHLNDHRDWLKWLEAAGITDAAMPRSVVFNQASMAIDAAIDGQGIALARSALAAWDLRMGRLVRPFELMLSVSYAYWIVCPRVSADLAKVATFRQWLLAQAETDVADLAQLGPRHVERATKAVHRPRGRNTRDRLF